MPDLQLKDLRVGRQAVDISLWREGTESCWKVTRGDPSLVEARSCAVGSLLNPTGG
jgi:hypothetical protein